MRFHIKLNCKGHSSTYDVAFPHCCVTPIQQFYLEPPLIIKWNSVEWAIFPPPCWDASHKKQCINAFEEAIKIDVTRTDGKGAAIYERHVTNKNAEVILETGFSNKYCFTWEWFEKDICKVCNKSAVTSEEHWHWQSIDITKRDIFEYAWEMSGGDMLSLHWVVKRIQELKPILKENINEKTSIIRVCGNSCAVKLIGTIHNVCKQVESELREWQHKQQEQKVNSLQVKKLKKLMVQLRKSVKENDHEALKLLRKELEQVVTLQE